MEEKRKMKKRFNLYLIVWAVLLALFNIIAFVSVIGIRDGEFTESFWIGYATVMIALFGQLFCAYMSFKANDENKTFYNISLIRTSFIGLIVCFAVGVFCMLIPALPYWICIIICVIALAFNIITVVKTTAVINEVSRIDEKVKVQTFFIKSLTIDADTLMAGAKSDEAKAECRKVYEAIRYSDPMSNDALSAVEGQISIKFAALSEAVNADDIEKVKELAKEVIVLVGDRNKKCMLLK